MPSLSRRERGSGRQKAKGERHKWVTFPAVSTSLTLIAITPKPHGEPTFQVHAFVSEWDSLRILRECEHGKSPLCACDLHRNHHSQLLRRASVPQSCLTARPTAITLPAAGNCHARGRREKRLCGELAADSPAGTTENSPALQRWVGRFSGRKSRQGRQRWGLGETAFVPAGTRLVSAPNPARKCGAIFCRPPGGVCD